MYANVLQSDGKKSIKEIAAEGLEMTKHAGNKTKQTTK